MIIITTLKIIETTKNYIIAILQGVMDNYDKHVRKISNHTCGSGLIGPIMNEITQPKDLLPNSASIER